MSKRPAVYRGILITPELLLALGATEDCADFKRFGEELRARGAIGAPLTSENLEWAQSANYNLYDFGKVLFPDSLGAPGTPDHIWAALPEKYVRDLEGVKQREDVPHDPFAVGKWVIRKGDGLVMRITGVDSKLPLLVWVGNPFASYRDSYTPLDGTPETCKLEWGDEIGIGEADISHKRWVIDIWGDAIGYRIKYKSGNIGHNGAPRQYARLICRPPKGEKNV